MADEKVNIPVEVTGAEQAKAELQGVGQAVQQVGQAAQRGPAGGAAILADVQAGRDVTAAQPGAGAAGLAGVQAGLTSAAAAQSKLAVETQGATRAFGGLNMAGRQLVTGLLGTINPTLGHAAGLAISFGRNIAQIGVNLLAFAGVGAAIGGVAMIFEKLADEARKAEEAIRRVSEAHLRAGENALGVRRDVARAFEQAGLYGRTEGGRRKVEQFGAEGIEKDVATFGAAAQALAGLTDDQARQVMGAWLATRRKAELTAERPAETQRQIRRLLGYDAEKAAAALAAKKVDTGLIARADAAVIPTDERDQRIAAAAQRMARSGEYTEREIEVAVELERGRPPVEIVGFKHWQSKGPFERAIAGLTGGETGDDVWTMKPPGDATHTMAELLKEIRDEIRYLRGDLGRAQPAPAPFNINVNTLRFDGRAGEMVQGAWDYR